MSWSFLSNSTLFSRISYCIYWHPSLKDTVQSWRLTENFLKNSLIMIYFDILTRVNAFSISLICLIHSYHTIRLPTPVKSFNNIVCRYSWQNIILTSQLVIGVRMFYKNKEGRAPFRKAQRVTAINLSFHLVLITPFVYSRKSNACETCRYFVFTRTWYS